MKVICEKCQAKYSIKDERVHGRILKIKCRKCGAVIEVADPLRSSIPPAAINRNAATPSAANGSPLADRFAQSFRHGAGAPSPASVEGGLDEAIRSAIPTTSGGPGAEVWYVAMDGQPVGPVSARKVASFRDRRQVTDRTLIWKEGLIDWMPLGDCAILVDLLAEVRRDTESLPAGPSIPPPSPEAAQLPTLWPPAATEPTACGHLPSIAPPAPTGSGRNWLITFRILFLSPIASFSVSARN